jgi:hypothetical protein
MWYYFSKKKLSIFYLKEFSFWYFEKLSLFDEDVQVPKSFAKTKT